MFSVDRTSQVPVYKATNASGTVVYKGTDAAQVLQQTADAVWRSGSGSGGTIAIPVGRYSFNENVRLNGNVALVGCLSGPFAVDSDYDYNAQDVAPVFLVTSKTLADTNPDRSLKPFITMEWNNAVRNILFFYPDQVAPTCTGTSVVCSTPVYPTAPVVYGPTVYVESSGNKVDGCTFINSYDAIYNHAGLNFIENLIVGAFHDGIIVDHTEDWVVIDNIINQAEWYGVRNPATGAFYGFPPSPPSNPLDFWVKEHGTALVVYRADDISINDFSVFYKGTGITIADSPEFDPVTAPAVPASGVEFHNPFPNDVRVTISGGSVTGIKVEGVNLGITSGTIFLPIDEHITITYSSPPTWSWTETIGTSYGVATNIRLEPLRLGINVTGIPSVGWTFNGLAIGCWYSCISINACPPPAAGLPGVCPRNPSVKFYWGTYQSRPMLEVVGGLFWYWDGTCPLLANAVFCTEKPIPVSIYGYFFADIESVIQLNSLGPLPGRLLPSPPVPASGTSMINPFGEPVTVLVGVGSVTGVSVNNVPTGMSSGEFQIPPGGSITLYYSGDDPALWSWSTSVAPASGEIVMNLYPFTVSVAVSGGTVSSIWIDGVNTGQTAGLFTLKPGESITMSYSNAPSWTWSGV